MEDGDRELTDSLLLSGGEREAQHLGPSDHPVAPDLDLQLERTCRELHRQPQLADVKIDGRLDPDTGTGDRQVDELTRQTGEPDRDVDGQAGARPTVPRELRGSDALDRGEQQREVQRHEEGCADGRPRHAVGDR